MINIPMNSTTPINRQTILTLNQQHIQSAKNSQTIPSINLEQTAAAPIPSQPLPHSAPVLSPDHPFSPPPALPIPPLIHPAQKGQKVPLETFQKLSKIQACLGWNISNPACDVDVSAFLLNSSQKVLKDTWFVFYGQQSSPDNSTLFSIAPKTDREIISIDFNKINPAVSKIVFVLTIHEALEKHLNFSMIKDAYIRIIEPTSHTELVSFQMDEYDSNIISMMIGEIYQYKSSWKFHAVGNGVARDLAGLCELYGVQVES